MTQQLEILSSVWKAAACGWWTAFTLVDQRQKKLLSHVGALVISECLWVIVRMNGWEMLLTALMHKEVDEVAI